MSLQQDTAIEILKVSKDGDELSQDELRLVELATNNKLSLRETVVLTGLLVKFQERSPK